MAQSSRDSLEVYVDGYVKLLNGVIYSEPLSIFLDDPYLLDNLLHNRINTELRYGHWTLNASLRTRAFWGDVVKTSPGFGESIESGNNDVWDLSEHIIESDGFLLNSYLDRLHLQYRLDQLEVTLGRQRINWGIHTFWNPHDLFNTYNFVDFDYEERPGSDALNLTYYQGFTGQIDLAVKYFEDWEDAILAGRYRFNIGTYDIQVIGGYFREDLVGGLGWAGNVGDGSFKGEIAYFKAIDSDESALVASAGGEYVFSDGFFLGAGFLYNQEGETSGGLTGLFNFELSARNLYPYRWSTYVSGQWTIGSLSSAGLTLIYSPVDMHPLFSVATITYSMAQNWDLDLTTQIAFDDSVENFKMQTIAFYLRFKWSF